MMDLYANVESSGRVGRLRWVPLPNNIRCTKW